jgi:hypothetical protein
VPLADVRQIFLLDERSQQDLRYFLDISRSEENHRTIAIRLSPGQHDLAVSYLVPSPTWRVSYRLVAEASAAEHGTGAPAQGTGAGTLLLQGWGLFDNRFEEHLDGVAVTLVAGQPISFVYDLAASRIPQRPVVQDAARIASGPVEFEDAMPVGMPVPEVEDTRFLRYARGRQMLMSSAQEFAAAKRGPAIEDLAQQPAGATGTDLGDLFQYDVSAPVTVRRGESALVPILSAQLPYRRELLFNERKLPDHPVTALRFTNSTGLVLERGPVTVIEDGNYRGEAMVPFTKEGGEVYLASAVELGVKVTVNRAAEQETAGIRIAGAMLEMKQATITRTTYRLENSLQSAHMVTIEHPLLVGTDLVRTPAPDARTAEYYRWTIPCRPRQATSFSVAERRFDWQVFELLDLAYARLQEFVRRSWLDAETLAQIDKLLAARSAIARNEKEIGRLEGERETIYRREEQLRQNMSALGSGGEEGELRKQVVAQLQTSEQRIGAIEARIETLRAENREHQATLDSELASISVADTSRPGGRCAAARAADFGRHILAGY